MSDLPVRILLLEADEIGSVAIEEAISPFGIACRVEVVRSERALTDSIAATAPHLVLLGTDDEALRALDILAVLRARWPSVPVVIVGRSIPYASAGDLIVAGARDCVSVDELGRLGPVVTRVLEDRRARLRREGIQERAEALHRILDQTTNEIYVLDAATFRFLHANRGACRNLGYSLEEMFERTPVDLAPGLTTELLTERMRPVLNGAVGELVYETAHRRRDGSTYPVELHIQTGEFEGRSVLLGIVIDISERVKNRARLDASELRFRTVADAIPSALIVADAGGNVTFWNPAAVQMFGYAEAEIVGRPLTDLVPERYRDRQLAEWRNSVVEGALPPLFTGRFEGRRADGSEFPVELSVAGWVSGGSTSVVALVRDVTEEALSRRALETSLQEQRALIEQLPAVVYSTSPAPEYAVRWISPQVADALGRPAADFTSDPGLLLSLIHPDDRPTVVKAGRTARESGAVKELVYRIAHADGSERWFRDRFSVLSDMDGEPDTVRGVLFDVTRTREIERQRALLSEAVEQSVNLVVITDRDASIEYVNAAFEAVTGYSPAEALGENPSLLRSGEHPPEFYGEMWAELTAGRPWSAEFTNRRKDGTLYRQRSIIFPVRDATDATVNYVCIGHDATKEHELEAQLRQAQKVESLGLLAGGIAHDFNNILTAILTSTEFVRAQLPEPPRHVVRDLREIRSAARAGTDLVRKLMAFARDDRMVLEVGDLREVVQEAVEILRRVVPERVVIDYEPCSDELPVALDRTGLAQILMNLGTNARDAMPRGGTLTVSMARVPAEFVETRSNDAVAGHYARLSVRDSGVGMDEETRRRICEPFFTTKDKRKGTGLGMSQVLGIVQRHEGYLAVDSRPGAGTTVTVFLPVAEHDELVGRSAGPGRMEGLGGAESILVVEDEPAIRRAEERILSALGYRVHTAADGVEALEVLAREQVDLVVSDLVMPNMGGIDLFRTASATEGCPRFLFTTGYADLEEVDEPGILDSQVFLRKPWEADELARSVRGVLDQAVPQG